MTNVILGRTLLILATLGGLAACGGAPEGPPGPNGGPNQLTILLDSVAPDYESVSLRATTTGTSALTLHLSASADPLKGAVDDEYSDSFDITFDRAALTALSAPVTVQVKGSLQYSSVGIGVETLLWTNAAGGSSLVTEALLRRSCFCAEVNPGTQSIEGTVVFTQLDASTVAGTFTFEVTGAIPNNDSTQAAHLEGVFDLSVVPAS